MPIRVYKLAKELGVTSKDVMAEAMNHGIEVQNHMGSLTEAQANMIRAFLYVAPPKTEAKPVQPAKKVVAPAKAETPTEPVPEAPTQPVELAIVSPPALAGTSPTAAPNGKRNGGADPGARRRGCPRAVRVHGGHRRFDHQPPPRRRKPRHRTTPRSKPRRRPSSHPW